LTSLPRLVLLIVPINIKNGVVVKSNEKVRNWVTYLYVNDGLVAQRDDALVLFFVA